jgi:O-antigen ligase
MHESQYFIAPFLVYAVVNCFFALNERWALRELEPYLPFVLALFGLWGVRQYKPRVEWFWAGLAAGAIGAAALSGYQATVLGWRAEGYTNSIQFGNISMLLGVLCLVRVMVVQNLGALNLLMWAGFVSGLAASAWSQTRGGWLAAIFIFIWLLIFAARGWNPLRRLIVFLGISILLASFMLRSDSLVKERIAEVVTQVKAFADTGESSNSVGIRLALWSVGIDEVKKLSILGNGNHGWVAVRDAAIVDERLTPDAKIIGHLHNEYLDVIVKRGVVGGVLLTILYFVPMLFFFRPNIYDSRDAVRSLAVAGVVVPVMLINFGLTQTFLIHNSGRIILCSIWVCIAALMLASKDE